MACHFLREKLDVQDLFWNGGKMAAYHFAVQDLLENDSQNRFWKMIVGTTIFNEMASNLSTAH